MPPVTIIITSDDPSPVPVQGVIVEFYNTLAVFQTSGTTDSNGEVQVTLPDGTYDILFFKIGITILPKQPQEIIVDSLLSNSFSVTAHIKSAPESINPIRCTVSGFIKGVGGGEAIHRLIFEPVRILTVLSKNVIAPYHRIEFTSDNTGYFQFELLRNTPYKAYFLFPQDIFNQQPGKLDIITPDSPSVLLHSLLFPIPLTFSFSVLTISLPVSPTPDLSVQVSATFTDGSLHTSFSTPWSGISLTITDNTVAGIALKDGGVLSIQPLKTGTCTISTIREIPSSVYFNPLPSYTTESLVITVT